MSSILKILLLVFVITVSISLLAPNAYADKYLKIFIYKDGGDTPSMHISVPLVVLHVAKNFLPKKIREDLEENEIDLGEILDNVEKQDLTGRIIDFTNAKKGKRIVIEIEER